MPDSICAMPWINLSMDVDGTSRPCCKFAHLSDESPYQLVKLQDADLEGVWNSDAMQRLRADFRRGERPADCSTCWDEEAVGIRSWRQTFMQDRHVTAQIDFDDVTPASPLALDLKLSNACNLKCRICGPVASSLWLQEQVKVGSEGEVADLRANRRLYLSNKITNDESNLATFRSWVPHLQHLEMTGGEPMFSAENREVIELLVAEGAPEQVTLQLTTNAMVIDDRIMRALDSFQHVSIALSIDDMGPRLEYERAPAVWETVLRNMRTYAASASTKRAIYVNCSISTLNIWYATEFAEWLCGSFSEAQIQLHFNLVHNPRHYQVQNLPEPLKLAVLERLQAGTVNPAIRRSVRDQLAELIDFVQGAEADPAAWHEFLRTTAERDAVRGERFASIFPEMWNEAERLGLTDLPSEPTLSASPVRLLGRRLRGRMAKVTAPSS